MDSSAALPSRVFGDDGEGEGEGEEEEEGGASSSLPRSRVERSTQPA
jgi:hypothetical protein